MSVSLSVDLPEAQAPEEGIPNFRWATVINQSPFTIRLDGDSVPLGAEPDSLVNPVNLPPGTRVWVQLFARCVLVLGATKGIGSGSGSGGTGGGLTAEQIQDLVATMIVAGTNVTKAYDDPAGTLTLSAASFATDPEVVRDTMAAALIAGSGVTITPNDAGDTITISATGGGGGTGVAGAAMPAGAITMWASSTPPTDWLICDGSAVSRTTYASLFTAIGTTYGTGDGTTTFNLPNLKGRTPVGRDSAQTEFDVLGETGGAKTHTLTTAEIPSHTHQQQRNGQAMVYTPTAAADGAVSGNRFTQAVGVEGGGLYQALAAGGGSGGAHNNLQPYQVLNFIIKASSDSTSGGGGATSDDVVYNYMGVF